MKICALPVQLNKHGRRLGSCERACPTVARDAVVTIAPHTLLVFLVVLSFFVVYKIVQ
jgi:hypothetical protein